MARKIDWESQIGRRLRLRDLHVFFTVVQRGSMAKAAAQLGVSQPAVSEVIADLEHALGVRLLDRSSQGVEPTMYGRALLKRGTVAFDELKQSIRDIEFLSDPGAGEVRIGCAESLASGILPEVVQQFSAKYPRVMLHVNQMVTPTLDLPELRERNLDLVIARLGRLVVGDGDELNVEVVYHDDLVVAAGAQSRWARRPSVDLAELVDEQWILTPSASWNDTVIAEAFKARGLPPPKATLTTFSVHLRATLLTMGPFLTSFPGSVLRANAERFSIKALPLDIPPAPWPVAVVTLKNRTLSPVVQLFIDHLRDFAKSAEQVAAIPQRPPGMRARGSA
jgi:DNA-binding transcriptional LysR family regulator